MEKRAHFKSAIWTVVLILLVVSVIAQPGFLSVDCGAKRNYTDPENNLTWVPDVNYIDVGQSGYSGDISQEADNSFMQYLRYFPMPLNKSCFRLPVEPSMPYLVRLWFAIGNYSGFDAFPIKFVFSIETRSMLAFQNVSFRSANFPYSFENILVSSGTVLCICLIRTSESHDPFISAIELRPLRNGMYQEATPGRMLTLVSRHDAGGNSFVRYPQDKFDRIWTSDYMGVLATSLNIVAVNNFQEPISTSNTQDLPPAIVMQTAWITTEDSLQLYLQSLSRTKSLLLLYFAEIQQLNMTETRSFKVQINGQISQPITIVQNYSAVELAFRLDGRQYIHLTLEKATDSTLRPMLNAFENYLVFDTDNATYSEDIEAIEAIKRRFHMKSWTSDPCYLVPWEGIGCDHDIRISKINLSGKNLTGSVPEDIGQLTSLVELSLDNNHLIGPLPNLSSLTRLERLHLQNNYLTGCVPNWLSQLKKLKELFIENNNFSGVIPPELVYNPSLIGSYTGNPHLCTDEGRCIQPTRNNSPKDNESVVLGITISGGLLISLGLLVTIAVFRKKFMKNYRREVMVPNAAKSHAFTLKEILAATQNFSQEIGQGGFGSVFFGKLPQGQGIAVKVLSPFSKQGIREFKNEVDLLSRINHKHLVSLLGYCIESKDLMLIYDHMSGGSLRDCLYGRAGVSELHWKSRLKIALDAEHGLEYLHVGCTPKIIHRDVKSANILLDNNLNGKLADFGLSRMTIDGEATHVTTTVKGTAGYLDPDYFRTQMLTDKSDVYSFGVVLLEIICGRPPIKANVAEEAVNLIQWVTPYVEIDKNPGQIEEIVDKRLGLNFDMKSVTLIAKLALRCVGAKPSSRPSMSEVVAEIKVAILHENENNVSFPNAERICIEYGNLQESAVLLQAEPSKPKDMEWADNSSNLPQVGR